MTRDQREGKTLPPDIEAEIDEMFSDDESRLAPSSGVELPEHLRRDVERYVDREEPKIKELVKGLMSGKRVERLMLTKLTPEEQRAIASGRLSPDDIQAIPDQLPDRADSEEIRARGREEE